MTIILPKDLEGLFKERMENGAYQTPEEMIRVGLRLLEAREKGMDALRSEIMRGVNDLKQGRFTTCTTDDELTDLSESTIAKFEGENDSVTSR
jgi:putative addiction module CopG family antidote